MNDKNNTIHVNLGQEFSKYPAGRVKSDGPHSGERFRDDILIPLLEGSHSVEVLLDDGVIGYGSSFLEECFGGLVRKGYSLEFLKKHLYLTCAQESFKFYIDEIWSYIEDQEQRG
ncbi:MAG: hypothetical protein CMF62_04540 [Magnetococcales bacterium]|nr:hypothetical protein [Magnetococcales bacterium]|tara:strand:+ start:15672 stop:16016 length:345 start_codon:yes stop_codon:yes gene_type:complete